MSSAMPAGSSPAATEGAFQQCAISAECPILYDSKAITPLFTEFGEPAKTIAGEQKVLF